ncbi:glycosyltransferase family 1 protein [Pedobacter psychrodurus]|uniref:Glycosyltransferase family 1 protein n=1 Tax=Pedobacter psychrodurus TaxID=2530456 RepID=A0A4R0Q038_9SPHI|nr:glycosyltransferase [Pedobacter psychrodurus]TCD23408.1 glycosyltransferase family 1 protein [Pedobacter psychrodurus]
MENLDIIIVGQQGWDTKIGSNCKDIAVEFSASNRVLYVNPSLDRITKWRYGKNKEVIEKLKVISGKKNGLEKINERLYVLNCDSILESINWLPPGRIYNYLNRLNNERLFKAIKKVTENLSFKSDVLFNDSDMFRSFFLKDLLKPKLSIYYSRDNMLATDYYRKHGAYMEPEIIAQSDLCFTNSAYLESYCRKYNPRSYNVGQGCDFTVFDRFVSSEEEKKLAHIPHPRIGYVGVLTSARLDISLIGNIAVSRPDWNIVLVGPEDASFQESSLHQIPNVHFLGARPVDELPAFIDEFDVCFNPQAVNELTIGNYPRKIDEYLALGKPTIATRTDAMEPFADYVDLAEDAKGYSNGIEKLLKEKDRVLTDKRKAFARSHTWKNSVGTMYRFMNKVNPVGP